MQTMIAVSIVVVGYLSGSVNYAIVVTRAVAGVDIRTLGNRNPGTANVSRNVGKGWAARLHPNPRPIEVWDDRANWPMMLEIRTDPMSPSGMMAEELRCFCRVVRGLEPVPVGATYQDAVQVQRWLDRLEASAKA